AWREYPDMAQPLWKFLLSIQNIALHGGTAFSHAWSLAVEDQFYLALPFILLVLFWRPRGAMILSCVIVVGGVLLRAFLAAQNPSVDGGVSFRGFQAWIYYPTWTRLDPLVFGAVIAAIEKFRPQLWQRLTISTIWLWVPALSLIAYSAYLVQKFVIHGVTEFCRAHAIDPKSAPALIGVELCVYAAATILFFTIERPFLQLRHRIAPRSRASSLSRNRQA